MYYKMITSFEEWNQYFDEFAALYELCFNQPMDREEVIWRYFKNPKKDIVACFAFEDEKLVANYSVSPVSLYYKGEVIKAAQSLNTMTHPDYMGRGLFVRLAKDVYSFLKENGYNLVWGFPNYISNRTFLTRLEWRDVLVIPTLEVDIANFRSIEVGENVLADNDFYLDYSKCLDNHDYIQVHKSNEYLKWRYANHPHIEYKTFAYSVDGVNATSRVICKEYKDILNVVDYSVKDEEEMQQLFAVVAAYAKSLNKNKITTWSKLGDDVHLLLEKFGAKNTAPITYFGNAIFNKDLADDYVDGRCWLLYMSDDNVY